MLWQFLAATTLAIHFGFVLFVVLGGLLVLRRRWIAWLHVPAVVWGAGIELAGGICPLTPLENHFRVLAGDVGYEVGFLEHYLIAILYPGSLTRTVQILLGVLVLALNGAVYWRVWRPELGRGPDR